MEEQAPVELKQHRFEQQPKPEKSGKEKIAIGYILCICGGLLGCFIGWHLYFHKRTLAGGEETYAYNPTARKHGRSILFLGIGFTIFWFLIRLYPLFFV